MDCPYVFSEGRNGGSDSFAGATFELRVRANTGVPRQFPSETGALTQLAAVAPLQFVFGCRRRSSTRGALARLPGFELWRESVRGFFSWGETLKRRVR